MADIFVFGSNLLGKHGKGAALCAFKEHGAIYGQAEGMQGNSYAIPTKLSPVVRLDLIQINKYVSDFIVFVSTCTEHTFNVTAIGCGLAGYQPNDIAPMFYYGMNLPNIRLPNEFIEILYPFSFDLLSI